MSKTRETVFKGIGNMDNASVRIEFLTSQYESPVLELSLDDCVSPRCQAEAFQRKYAKGPDLFCRQLVVRWQMGLLDHYEALRWLCRADCVKFADLPRDPAAWEEWLSAYARGLERADPLDLAAAPA